MKILAVTSGKGGVGKTTLTLNIARQASLRGLRTLIIDFDIHNKGATSLFLPQLSATGSSTLSIATESDGFDPARAEEIASRAEVASLDAAGTLLLIPASKPAEMVQWASLVAPNQRIVEFFRRFLTSLATRHRLAAIVIDCYGGVDTLTVAAAAVADDTVVVNEPDVITFSGTLLLYKYLAETYKDASRKPHVHFVINRITPKHTFRFLEREYEAHLSQLAVTRSVLAYLPYDKVVVETFGDYPFITELLPRGLLTAKILLLMGRLWGEEFQYLAPRSARAARKTHERTHESIYVDPEWIIRTSATAPIWILVPGLLLYALSRGIGGSLHYATIMGVYLLGITVLTGVVLFVGVFQPIQLSRWLIRHAGYRRRKRNLQAEGFAAYNAVLSVAELCRAAVPAVAAVAVFLLALTLTLGVAVTDPAPVRDLRIWPGEVSGFRPGGHYRGLQLNRRSWLKLGTSLRGADLRQASVPLLLGADLREAQLEEASLDESDLTAAKLEGADLEGASLSRAYLIGAELRGANLRSGSIGNTWLDNADLQAASLQHADFTKTDLRTTNLAGADLGEAVLDSTTLVGANLYRANLSGALGLDDEALSYARAAGARLDPEQLRKAMAWRPRRGRAPWLEPSWVTAEQRAEEDVHLRLGALDTGNSVSPATAHARLDMIELLLVDRHPDALRRADAMLDAIDAAPADSLMYPYQVGIAKLLRILHRILAARPPDKAAWEWCTWADQHGPLSNASLWSWTMWNDHVPAYRYSADINERLRAVQHSARGVMTGKQLCSRYFAPQATPVGTP